MAYQSLYRRYRSRTFSELVGQQHVVTALKNAITDDRVGHAYLFSGPRGTGKTSTARILGKALNCTDLGDDGEPCCACESCAAFESGTSYDLQELDAASNNGVEAIRDLISKVALGSPGRTKVYILDEVHMLTAGAENALLKTLEEPPDHVVFVLATTEPHKVVPTIRSRTQHYEFELIGADELGKHVRYVAEDAGLDIDDDKVDYVLRVGGGSARDTLSALDQVVAAGGVPRDDDVIDAVADGLSSKDSGQTIAAVGEALKAGRDPRVIGEMVLDRLRDAFLSSMKAPVDHLSQAQAAGAASMAEQMGPASITRALEVVGSALIAMRQAPDPRVDLEVALLRLTRPDLDTDLGAVVARLERLERGAGPAAEVSRPADDARASLPSSPVTEEVAPQASRPADGARAALASPPPSEDVAAPASPPADEERGASASPPPNEAVAPKATLGARRASAKQSSPPVDQPPDTPAPTPAAVEEASPASVPDESPPASTGGASVALADIEQAWDDIKAQLPGRAKSRFSGGRFISSTDGVVVFGLPNAIHRDRCQECAADVEGALATHFGSAISLQLIVDGDAVAPTPRAPEPAAAKPAPTQAPDETVDVHTLTDAEPDAAGGVDLLTDAFPGAELVDTDPE